MFWDTKDPPSHNIEILLESPDTKVEVFLEEDNIIQECKTLNKNIVNYFTRPDVVRRMIELITTEPPEEVPISERFRHANVACEILTMGLPSLDEKLLAEIDTLNLLYSYLENEPPLNPLLASFFSKTFSMLFAKKSDQDWFLYQQTCLKLLEYLKTKSNFLDLICKHFATPVVPDVIMEMMQNVEGAQLKKSLFKWLNEERLIEKLIEIIGDPEQSEKHGNVADFICELIRQGRTMRQDIDTFEPLFEGSDPILKKIESATTLLALFNVILQPNNVESAIVSGVTVVLKIIKPAEVTDERNVDRMLSFLAREEKFRDEFLTTVIRVIEPQLKHFNELLKNPPKKSDILTSVAHLSPAFGMTRLQIVRLFTELLATKNDEITKAICETDFLETLLSLFKEFCWNNFLHAEVEKCFRNIFPYSFKPSQHKTNNAVPVSIGTNENADTSKSFDEPASTLDKIDEIHFFPWDGNTKPSIPESTPSIIQTHAITNCKIISKLIDCWKTNKEIESAEKGRRLGYMGHLINIFKHITKCISESEHIGALIESNFIDDNERASWQSIVNATDGELTNALNAQSKLLANCEPCEHNVSLDFFTDNNISDAFNGLCTLMDSSDAFRRSDDDDEGEDDNASAPFDCDGGLSFYSEPRLNSFPQKPSDELNDLLSHVGEIHPDPNTEYLRSYNALVSMFKRPSTSNTNNETNVVAETTAIATANSEDYDNNANVEKSSSWSGDFASFQLPKPQMQFDNNFLDDYEDDEGMWTKPLGVSPSTTTFEKPETQLFEGTNQIGDCETNLITNGPIVLKDGENGPDESPPNQLNNSIEDNTLIDQTAEDITSSANNEYEEKQEEEEDKKINNELNLKDEAEITTSKHKSNAFNINDNKIGNTTATTITAKNNTNQQANTTAAAEEISDGSTITITTT